MPRRHWSVLEIRVGCLPVEGIGVLRNRMPKRKVGLSRKASEGCLGVLRVKICLGGFRFLDLVGIMPAWPVGKDHYPSNSLEFLK